MPLKKSKKSGDSKVDKALNGQKIDCDMGIKPKKTKRKASKRVDKSYDVSVME